MAASENRPVSIIRWRFYAVTLYELFRRSFPDKSVVRDSYVKELYATAGLDPIENTPHSLCRLIKAGQRMSEFCGQFSIRGGRPDFSYLFVTSIPDEIWDNDRGVYKRQQQEWAENITSARWPQKAYYQWLADLLFTEQQRLWDAGWPLLSSTVPVADEPPAKRRRTAHASPATTNQSSPAADYGQLRLNSSTKDNPESTVCPDSTGADSASSGSGDESISLTFSMYDTCCALFSHIQSGAPLALGDYAVNGPQFSNFDNSTLFQLPDYFQSDMSTTPM
ncbi:hypothetical protein MY11210_009379 [Beauveria gryllotalpidicola]